MPETKAKIAHNDRISLYATAGIGQEELSLDAPAFRLKKSCKGGNKQFPTCLTLTQMLYSDSQAPWQFPVQSPTLERFGIKFSPGGAHISRTMMLAELESVLVAISHNSKITEYRAAIIDRNILGKSTESTRQKSLRHLRELYALDEDVAIFGLLRKLYAIDPSSLPSLAIQVAWARDPLLRATSARILESDENDVIIPSDLSAAIEVTFPGQYSELNRDKIARNALSSWSQSGHLLGRTKKVRRRVKTTSAAVTLALFLGEITGYHGAAVFSNPWCRLLDLNADRAKALGLESHRAGLLNLRAIGDVVEISFPSLINFQPAPA